MPFDLAELSVEELRSSGRIRDEAKCSGSAVWGTLDLRSGGAEFVNGNCLPCRVKCSETKQNPKTEISLLVNYLSPLALALGGAISDAIT